MIKPEATNRLSSLRLHLLLWFGGCAIAMVFAYTELLEYYLEQGIALRTQSFLERIAEDYDTEQALAPNIGQTELPQGPNYVAYSNLDAIPEAFAEVFPTQALAHGQIERFINLRFEDDDDNVRRFRIETQDLCPEGACELLFLYPYQLRDGAWLYLIHGLVGSDVAFAELEFAEQVAFGIGSLFAALLLIVSWIVIRNIDVPLRRLNQWSANQAADTVDQPLPDLRFREFDALARRIRGAFKSMREGIENEERFLRHASHELRTPLAVLSANLELLDRLSASDERPEAQQAAFVRQYRALDDIRLLTETLLWVHRKSEDPPAAEQVDLKATVERLIQQHDHLLAGKSIAISVAGQGGVLAPAAAVTIVLSNLVRNALQHTPDGRIDFIVADAQVEITSVSMDSSATEDSVHGEQSFGLGLELVALLCERLAWGYCTQPLMRSDTETQTSTHPEGWVSSVDFGRAGSEDRR
ncbi:MAG: sensor histidine kinase [Pseudomonadota bacterium]